LRLPRTGNLALIIALLIAAALRFCGLGTPEFWADENTALATQSRPVKTIIAERMGPAEGINIEPPLYHLINKTAMILLPRS